MISTRFFKWGKIAHPIKIAICCTILIPVCRACHDFLLLQTAFKKGNREGIPNAEATTANALKQNKVNELGEKTQKLINFGCQKIGGFVLASTKIWDCTCFSSTIRVEAPRMKMFVMRGGWMFWSILKKGEWIEILLRTILAALFSYFGRFFYSVAPLCPQTSQQQLK